MRVQHEIAVDAPPSRVWCLTVDVEALPDHTPTMTEVTRLDQAPLTVGSKVRIKQPLQRAKIWTVTEFDPNRRIAWSTRSAGMAMTATHDIAETSTGTTNTLTVDMTGPLGTVLGRLVRRQIATALSTENSGLKTAAEQ